MNGSPSVSLIVVNYNGRSKLKTLFGDCISSLLRTDYPNFEILFVDNHSSDSSVDHIKEMFSEDRLRILSFDQNLGYAAAANRALQLAKGDLVAVLNNDIVSPRDWLRTLVDTIQLGGEIGIVCPKLLLLDNPSYANSYGGQVNALLVAWDRHLFEKDVGHDQRLQFVFSPAGAAFLIKRQVLEKLNGELFDPDFFAYYEDVDLGWRALHSQFKTVCNPKAVVYHKHGGSFGVVTPKKFYLFRRNAIRSGIKNCETPAVLTLLPLWLLSSIYGSYVYFRVRRDAKFLLAGFHVAFDVLKDFRRFWKKHERLNQTPIRMRDLPLSNTLMCSKASPANRVLVEFVNKWLKLAGLENLAIKRVIEYPYLALSQ